MLSIWQRSGPPVMSQSKYSQKNCVCECLFHFPVLGVALKPLDTSFQEAHHRTFPKKFQLFSYRFLYKIQMNSFGDNIHWFILHVSFVVILPWLWWAKHTPGPDFLSFQQEHQTALKIKVTCAPLHLSVCALTFLHFAASFFLLAAACVLRWQAATAQVLHHKAAETPSVHCLKALPMARRPQPSAVHILKCSV